MHKLICGNKEPLHIKFECTQIKKKCVLNKTTNKRLFLTQSENIVSEDVLFTSTIYMFRLNIIQNM